MTTETLTPAEIDYRSRAWIAANSVTLDKIHFTPSFKHIGDFANWLANQAEVKPWFAWNGDLHSTRLLLQAGYLTMHAQGRLEHVPGAPT